MYGLALVENVTNVDPQCRVASFIVDPNLSGSHRAAVGNGGPDRQLRIALLATDARIIRTIAAVSRSWRGSCGCESLPATPRCRELTGNTAPRPINHSCLKHRICEANSRCQRVGVSENQTRSFAATRERQRPADPRLLPTAEAIGTPVRILRVVHQERECLPKHDQANPRLPQRLSLTVASSSLSMMVPERERGIPSLSPLRHQPQQRVSLADAAPVRPSGCRGRATSIPPELPGRQRQIQGVPDAHALRARNRPRSAGVEARIILASMGAP
jgi:hypothetical protein